MEEWTGDAGEIWICEIVVVEVVVEACLYHAGLNWLDSKGDQGQIEAEDGKTKTG